MTLEDMMDMMMSNEETTNVYVRLLSGEILSVSIRMTDRLELFPNLFARQYGYNPHIVPRMRFYDNNLIDEEQSISSWKSIESSPWTWKAVYGYAERVPLLNLMIELDDKEKSSKLEMIRMILNNKNWGYNYDDEILYSDYLAWNLYYQPPENSNRYINLTNFVEQNGNLFFQRGF